MSESEEQARLHDQENRAGFAIEREEHAMAAEERQLEREMEDQEEAEAQAKREIETELRQEHWGHTPWPIAWEKP